jgi:hypothetical protein
LEGSVGRGGTGDLHGKARFDVIVIHSTLSSSKNKERKEGNLMTRFIFEGKQILAVAEDPGIL